MEKKLNQESLAGRLASVARKAEANQRPEGPARYFDHEGVRFWLSGRGLSDFDALVRDLLQGWRWGERLSERSIERWLFELIGDLASNTEVSFAVAQSLASQLVERYASTDAEHRVLIPIWNLTLEDRSTFEFAGITLRRVTSDLINEVVEAARAVNLRSKSPREVTAAAEETLQQHLTAYDGWTMADYRVTAEPVRARERAEEAVRIAIDLLRFATPFIYSHRPRYKVDIGLVGETTTSHRQIFVTGPTHWNFDTQVVGPLVEFAIADRTVQQMDELGVLDIGHLITRPAESVSEFEHHLIRAVRWFARAHHHNELEDSLLSLTTSLEALLTRAGEPITKSASEGAAFLLADDLESRRQIRDEIQRLYRLRSSISHGESQTILVEDVVVLRELVGAVTLTALARRSEFTTKADLLAWIDRQRLA